MNTTNEPSLGASLATAETNPMSASTSMLTTDHPASPGLHGVPTEPASQDPVCPIQFTRGDPLAITLFRFLELRPGPDCDHVLGAIALRRGASADAATVGLERLQRVGPAHQDSARTALALQSLRLAADDLKRVPSRREYDRWHSAHPGRAELANSSFIRRTFDDSWVEAVAQVGAPIADITARRLLRNGKAFTEAQKDLALRLFVEAVPPGKRTQAAFKRWARSYVQQPGAFDIPTSAQGLVKGRTRSWHELLESIGAGEARYRVIKTASRANRASLKTPGQILDLLRLAASDLGVPAPTSIEYQRWVETYLDEYGNRLAPASSTVMARFGGWSIALRRAGLLSEEQFAVYWTRRAMRLSDGRLLEFVAAAVRDGDPELGRLAYRAWRWELLRHPDWPLDGCIPSDMSIVDRFGSWQEAVVRAKDVPTAAEIPQGMHASGSAVWTKRDSKMDRGRS
jgi:hypothetical protein